MRKILLMLCLAFGMFHTTQAQISHGGEPLSWNGKIDTEVVFDRLPQFNEESMRAEDAINNVSKDVPYRFGNNFYIDYSLNNSGQWQTLPNGDKLWLLGIESEGAYSLNFIFDEFYLPHGATLFIYNEDRTQFIGSFNSENNNPEESFATYPVQGDKIIIEYFEPQRVAGMGKLSMESITHAYRDIEAYARGLGDSGSCNNNVICPVSAGWEDQINSVAMIVVNGNGICTGALVNNTANDGHPYFLTADHCTGGGVTNWVFRFNWQSPSCAANETSAFDTVNGSQLLASGGSADYCLLRINNGNPIPTAYNPYYAGWDATGVGPSNQVGIHHPSGDIKKISFDVNPAGTATYGGATCWRIFNWEDGTTEPGSSGSPLFDQNKRIIGQLYGGQATCSNNVNDYYGKFDVTFPNVCQWLSPGCNTLIVDGYDPNTPTTSVDAQLLSISSPSGSICGLSTVPELTVRNAGSNTLNSFTVSYNVDGGANQNFPWTGALASGASVVITLPAINSTAGAHTFNANITNPNGGADDNPGNNAGSSAFNMIAGGSLVTFSISTDCWGEETSWVLAEQGGATIQSVGVNTLADLTTFNYDFCLAEGCYDLTISDSFGDGLEGSLYACGIDGDYNVIQDGGTVLVQMASAAFGTGITENFCVIGSGDIPGCTNPSACNFDAGATLDDGSCILAPAGDTCADAILISVNGGTVNGSTAVTCDNGPNPNCGGTGIVDLWYEFNYTGGDISIAATVGTLTDTRLAVYSACGGAQIACNDDFGGLLSSQINLSCAQLNAGQSYFIQVGGFNNLSGAFSLTVTGTDTEGCTTVGACNYDPAAICDDGSCIFPGCTDPTACNYDGTAGCDDGSCILPLWYLPNTIGAGPIVQACSAPAGYFLADQGCAQTVVDNDPFCVNTNWDDICSAAYNCCLGNFGCGDPSACNYNPALCDDPSLCTYPGCTNPAACNFNSSAGCDDGSCILPGCTNPAACNFNSSAGCDDGSCTLPGCTNPAACNFNSSAGCDDGSCTLPGCNNPAACNFDPAAGCDDGSCTLPTTWYQDNDADGVGSSVSTNACTQPAGYVSATGDCDDTNSDVYPGAPPTAEGIDNDCSGVVDPDEELPSCMGDFNNDGQRNVSDLLFLLGEYGCSGSCLADMNGDNTVNTGDMTTFLSIFGTSCP